ncbi:MAG: TRAP transporter substrate-binding protein DctP [Spirochaetaceae bacterium]|jgi:TRAP-type C4-dicarboxylate transport system substrate-binding protein|nr:TRAP transporter substrate-binding protein DctP [Spirochaetaceae bacterium]
MKKFGPLLVVILLCFVVSPVTVFAQRRLTVKLASLVPEHSPWGEKLMQIAAEWSRITNGEVELVVSHNGVAGSEATVLQKLNANQIQAAVFTSFGLNQISPEIMTLSCPFLIRSDEELDLVLEGLKPELEEKINQKNYVMLAWSKAGWVNVFSKAPVFVPADLKRQKLGTNPQDQKLTQAFTAMGFRMVAVDLNDVQVKLASGMIEAVYQSPASVAGYQIFGSAKNMASIKIAPFMGGIVINNTAWRRIPERYKPELLRVTRRIAAELDTSILDLEERAVSAMVNNGLIVNRLNRDQEQLWYTDMERALPNLLGATFDRDMYQKIEAIVRNYRNGR